MMGERQCIFRELFTGPQRRSITPGQRWSWSVATRGLAPATRRAPAQRPLRVPGPARGQAVHPRQAQDFGIAVVRPAAADGLPVEGDVGHGSGHAHDRDVAERVGVCVGARRLCCDGGVGGGELQGGGFVSVPWACVQAPKRRRSLRKVRRVGRQLTCTHVVAFGATLSPSSKYSVPVARPATSSATSSPHGFARLAAVVSPGS